jgi:hypothetical protein
MTLSTGARLGPYEIAAALDAVARRFAATWKQASSSGASINVAGKQVAVDVITLKQRGAGKDDTKPRLRFDKVVVRLLEHLRATLGATVPDGMSVLLTVTAPIRLPSKTAAALEDRIQTLLRKGSSARDHKATILGNRVRIRLSRVESMRAPKVIGFVHNADSDPLVLLNMTREWLDLIDAETVRRATRSSGDRWLVVICARGRSSLEAYRDICSQLRLATDHKKILMVFGDGRVEALAE